jgi:hypothetical protein
VTKCTWEVLPYLQAAQQKTAGVFGNAFPLLNKLVVWGADFFRRDPASISFVLQLCELCLFAQPGNKPQEAKTSEAALIYHLLLQTLPGEMGQHVSRILSSVFRRYSQAICNDFLRIKLLNTALCAMSIDPQGTMELLARQQASEHCSLLAYVLDEVCRLKEDYFYSYDTKTAVIGLCRLLQQESLQTDVVNRLKSLFEAIIAILNASAASPEPRPRSDLDEMLDELMADTDDSTTISISRTTLSSMGLLATTDEREFNTTMSLFESPMYDSLDEYDCLRQMLSHLQAVNPEALRVLVAPLPQLRQQQLGELVQRRRLSSQTTSARRIVKARHRTAK